MRVDKTNNLVSMYATLNNINHLVHPAKLYCTAVMVDNSIATQ